MAPMKTLLPPIEIAREGDGATLLCLSRRDVPKCAGWLGCAGGQLLQRRGQGDLAAMAAELFSEGPAGVDPLAWRRELEQDAITAGVQAAPGQWVGHLGCLSEDLPAAADRLAALLAGPALDAGRWKQIVRRHRGAMAEQLAQPAEMIRHLPSRQVLGPDHPNAQAPHAKVVAAHRHADAAAMARAAFQRRGSVFAAIGGDVSAEDGFDLLRTLTGLVAPADAPLPPEPAPAPSPADVWVMDLPKTTQAFVALSRVGVRAGDPDRLALRLAVRILGGGLTGRLMRRVRGEMGQTYGISASLPEQPARTPFAIQTFTRLDNLPRMLELIDAVLTETAAEGFTDEEIDTARRYLHGSLPLGLTSPSAVLRFVADGMRAGLTLDDIEADWRAILDTGADAIHAAARRLIGDGHFHLAVIAPAKEVLPAVADRGTVATFRFRNPPDRWPNRRKQ